jgi:hypothetical protein
MTPHEVLDRAFPHESNPDPPLPCRDPRCSPDTSAPSTWAAIRPCTDPEGHHPLNGTDLPNVPYLPGAPEADTTGRVFW